MKTNFKKTCKIIKEIEELNKDVKGQLQSLLYSHYYLTELSGEIRRRIKISDCLSKNEHNENYDGRVSFYNFHNQGSPAKGSITYICYEQMSRDGDIGFGFIFWYNRALSGNYKQLFKNCSGELNRFSALEFAIIYKFIQFIQSTTEYAFPSKSMEFFSSVKMMLDYYKTYFPN